MHVPLRDILSDMSRQEKHTWNAYSFVDNALGDILSFAKFHNLSLIY